jgi:chemotaxis regulatin CheY-phosphate phosphatase CheZ
MTTQQQADPAFLQARLKRLTNDLHTAQHEVTRIDARIDSTQEQIIENLDRMRALVPEARKALQGVELVTAAEEHLQSLSEALSTELDALSAILDSLPQDES